MADIDLSVTGDGARYTAISTRGDDWMTAHYNSIDVSFDLSQASEAKSFREEAEAAGLTIREV